MATGYPGAPILPSYSDIHAGNNSSGRSGDSKVPPTLTATSTVRPGKPKTLKEMMAENDQILVKIHDQILVKIHHLLSFVSKHRELENVNDGEFSELNLSELHSLEKATCLALLQKERGCVMTRQHELGIEIAKLSERAFSEQDEDLARRLRSADDSVERIEILLSQIAIMIMDNKKIPSPDYNKLFKVNASSFKTTQEGGGGLETDSTAGELDVYSSSCNSKSNSNPKANPTLIAGQPLTLETMLAEIDQNLEHVYAQTAAFYKGSVTAKDFLERNMLSLFSTQRNVSLNLLEEERRRLLNLQHELRLEFVRKNNGRPYLDQVRDLSNRLEILEESIERIENLLDQIGIMVINNHGCPQLEYKKLFTVTMTTSSSSSSTITMNGGKGQTPRETQPLARFYSSDWKAARAIVQRELDQLRRERSMLLMTRFGASP
ncbi:hypothetical protein BGZ83_005337 [Gryganskiella cystojenkinii]|nr:hypothetical protein BGZ83_005337 [Gryganskiella cystojenkinii]